jgi:phosphoglucosamine mutase
VGRYFGTDGIRGVVNGTDAGHRLDADIAFKVGQAAAMVLAEGKTEKPVFTIGKDTRISGDMLEAALIAGLCSAGADVMVLGVVPTPAVAYITVDARADAGIVISASHNPYEHNGIKIFNGQGFKLSDALEEKIEYYIDHPEKLTEKTHSDLGRVIHRGQEYLDRYIEHIVEAADTIQPMKVLIDCANGAASRTANQIFSRFPLDLEIIKDHPDGININDGCGSTHIDLLGRMVQAGGYDMGIAFDGDADRCLAVDETGREVDGDKIMAICGTTMKSQGKLNGNAIVATVMSNMGFHDYTKANGMQLVCTSVGDRNVLEKMLECNYSIGGEQSGHLIFLEHATTGDGQLAAVKFLSIVSSSGRKLSELVSEIPEYPQILNNVSIAGGNAVKQAIMQNPVLQDSIAAEETALQGKGRILIRPSGTEALIRVMVEAQQSDAAKACAERLTACIEQLAKS